MQLIVKAALVRSITDVEVFIITVNYKNYLIVRKKLESQVDFIINTLKELQSLGEIKSVSKPRNKKIQTHLNRLVDVKKILKHSD